MAPGFPAAMARKKGGKLAKRYAHAQVKRKPNPNSTNYETVSADMYMTAEERRTDRYMAERAAALAKVHMNTPIGDNRANAPRPPHLIPVDRAALRSGSSGGGARSNVRNSVSSLVPTSTPWVLTTYLDLADAYPLAADAVGSSAIKV